MISVLIVDDEHLTRAALRTLLETDPGIRVVADCSGVEAVETARSSHPDVVLLDMRMPEVDGISVLHGLQSLAEQPVTVMMTRFATDEDVQRSFASGAHGYLLKDVSVEDLTNAVHKAQAGVGVVAEPVAPSVIAGYRSLALRSGDTVQARELAAALTVRERDVLRLLADGLSNREIADRLVVSPETVKSHLASVFNKLGTGSRVRAALIAERVGLLRSQP